jgi:hypothetical protein
MIDLALTADHDLDTSTLDLLLISDADQVRQQLLIKLRLWRGEWFLDTEFGTPYLQDILGKRLTLSGAIAAIKAAILEVSGVKSIATFSSKFNNQTRTLTVAFAADTAWGTVEVQA